MPDAYDVIVVGARCAGSPTAMLLARKGHKVLLLDRASFPSDKLSTHYLHQPAIARMNRWGLLPRLIATNCPPIRRQRLDVGPFALEGSPTPADGIADAYAPRRTVLDKLLVDAAVESGAVLREKFTVEEVVSDGGRVTGIRGHAQGGGSVVEKARIVIGADGMRSLVAKNVKASEYNARGTFTCAFYTYWDGVAVEIAELYPRPGRMIIAAPTNDGRVLTIVYWPRSSFQEVRTDVEGSFMRALELAPSLAARVKQGKRSERFHGTDDLPNFFRKASGPGWALVGDAGYHKDPILALGITDAFRDAELLSDAIDSGLSGRRSLDDALAGYGQTRDQLAMPGFETSVQFAKLEPPPPETQQLFGALRGNQEQTDRFFGTFGGSVSPAEFFAPENMAKIFGGKPA